MGYPLIKPNPPKPTEWAKYLEESYKTHVFSNFGPAVTQLQEKLRSYLNLSITPLTFCNATLALEIIIESLEIKGKEVLIPSYTFGATILAAERVGCVPVLVDNDLQTWHLCLKSAKEKLTTNTKALILVHPLGLVKELQEYINFCNENNLYLIIDAAASFGAVYKNSSWTDGTCQIFSHHITKTFGCGESGSVVSKDEKLLEKWRRLSNFGLNNDSEVEFLGTNAKMSDFQAAVNLAVLENFSEKLRRRREIAKIYRENLNNLCAPQTTNDEQHTYSMFPLIYLGNILQLKERLEKEGIGYRQYYKPLHWHVRYKNRSQHLPNADLLGERVMCLPSYETLNNEDIKYICDIINA